MRNTDLTARGPPSLPASVLRLRRDVEDMRGTGVAVVRADDIRAVLDALGMPGMYSLPAKPRRAKNACA